MQFRITISQLRTALDQMTLAEQRGFTASFAVFKPFAAPFDNPNYSSVVDAAFSDVWCRAHPTDPCQDWGRNPDRPAYSDCKVVNGRLVPLTPEAS